MSCIHHHRYCYRYRHRHRHRHLHLVLPVSELESLEDAFEFSHSVRLDCSSTAVNYRAGEVIVRPLCCLHLSIRPSCLPILFAGKHSEIFLRYPPLRPCREALIVRNLLADSMVICIGKILQRRNLREALAYI